MMSAQSELRNPARSDSPILPAPRMAPRIAHLLIRQDYESLVVSRQQIDAREAGPLAVGLEQRVRFPRPLDAPPPESRGGLHSPRSPGEAALVPAEPFQRDDADRPRAEPALALEPPGDGGSRQALQCFEVERAAEPDEPPRPPARPGRSVGARRVRSARGRAQVGAACSSRAKALPCGRSRARSPARVSRDQL